MGLLGRYLTGLCVAALGLCVAGWLVLMPLAFGNRGRGPHQAALAEAALTERATGGGLALVSLVTLLAWAIAWRRKLRADGIVAPTTRRQSWRVARALRRRQRESDKAGSAPDPAQVLSELRALLIPLLAEPANGRPADGEPAAGKPADGEPAAGKPADGEPAAGKPAAGEPAASPGVAGIPAPRKEQQEAFGVPDGFQSPAGDPDYYEPGPEGYWPARGDPDSYQPSPDGHHPAPAGHHPAPAAFAHYPPAPDRPAVPPARSGLASMESMLAGAELRMAGGEEEAW
jgi:hypothetical protein